MENDAEVAREVGYLVVVGEAGTLHVHQVDTVGEGERTLVPGPQRQVDAERAVGDERADAGHVVARAEVELAGGDEEQPRLARQRREQLRRPMVPVEVVGGDRPALVRQHVEQELLALAQLEQAVVRPDDLAVRRERSGRQRLCLHGHDLGHAASLPHVPAPDVIAERLAALGLVLPSPHAPHEPVDPVLVHAGVARVSGQLPRLDGGLTSGTVGADLTEEQGYAAARACALNVLAALDHTVGLDRVTRLLHVTGYVACVPGYDRVAQVVDGASQLLVEVLGEAGRHTRTAIGVTALPRGAAVEVEATAAVG